MDLNTVCNKALEEHWEIKRIIHHLRKQVRCGMGLDSTSAEGLADVLTQLTSHLKAHFAIEEEGGFMVPVVEQHPQSAAVIESLRKEHEEILDLCDLALQVLVSNAVSPDKKTGVCETINNLIQQLENHERIEDELIQSVYVHDIGAND